MHNRPRCFLLMAGLVSGAMFSTVAHAQIVSIADQKLKQCGSGSVVCDGVSAFSLRDIENGVVQLPIADSHTPEFVVVNDTGAPVRYLTLTYFGELSANAHMGCQVDGKAKQYVGSCMVLDEGSANGASSIVSPVTPPVELAFIASSQDSGIPEGAYFDIKTAGFSHGGQDQGYLSGGEEAVPLFTLVPRSVFDPLRGLSLAR